MNVFAKSLWQLLLRASRWRSQHEMLFFELLCKISRPQP
jgi:hypothetical protein